MARLKRMNRWNSQSRLTRWLLGAVLLLAAGLKGFDQFTQLPPTPPPSPLATTGQWGVAAVELVFGLWLLSGWRWRTARSVAILWMLALCGISLQKAWSGAASCGCFGMLEVNPWLTFGLDTVALAALLATPSGRTKTLGAWRRVALGGAQFMLLGALVLVLWSPVRRPVPAPPPPPGKVELQVEKWVGEPQWSLGRYIDVWDTLSHGKWVVLLHGAPCHACTATMDAYEDLARTWRDQKAATRVALIDTIGDFSGSPNDDSGSPNCAALHGTLGGPSEWYIPSPTVVILIDGRVVETEQGYEDCVWGDRSFPE